MVDGIIRLSESLGAWPTVCIVVGCAFAVVGFYWVLFR